MFLFGFVYFIFGLAFIVLFCSVVKTMVLCLVLYVLKSVNKIVLKNKMAMLKAVSTLAPKNRINQKLSARLSFCTMNNFFKRPLETKFNGPPS